MGWSIRKSFSIGKLLRFNVSRSGIGASIGVRGARVSIDPRGRSSLNVGAGGLHARHALGGGGRRLRKARGNASVGIAVSVLAVAVMAFALLWPSAPKAAAKPVTVEKPAFVPMVAPAAPPSAARPAAVVVVKDEAKSPPVASAPAPEEWKLKDGGIDGGAVPNLLPGQKPRGNVRVDAGTTMSGSTGRVWVDGYRKKDGTMVEGHWRER